MEDEEELYLFPWLDPKNEGVKYSEEEAREYLGNSTWADKEIESLKEEGVVHRNVEENNEYLNNKLENYKEDNLDLYLSERYDKDEKIAKLIENNEGLTRDEKLDLYQANLLDDGYDRKGYMMIQDMKSNIENISEFMNGDFKEMQGRFAKANQNIIDYSLSNLKSVYYYISDSMIPAMDAVKNLSDILRKRLAKQKEIETENTHLHYLWNNEPDKQEYMKVPTTQRDKDGKLQEVYVYQWVNSIKHWEWECDVRDTMDRIEEKKKELETISQEAEECLELVNKYENENIEFTNFVDDML